jgi:hypothetical protein
MFLLGATFGRLASETNSFGSGMNEKHPFQHGPEFDVVAEDGTRFHCAHFTTTGATRAEEVRWAFTDNHGNRYVGPSAAVQFTSDEITAYVRDWWTQKCALGQQGVNAGKMRNWLRNGR